MILPQEFWKGHNGKEDNIKKVVIFLVFFLFIVNLSFGNLCQPPQIPKNPTADELMKAWFEIKFTRYGDDITYPDLTVIMLDKSGFKREKKCVRKRIILHDERGFDYKDLIVITAPEYTKGVAILTWAYTDINKQNDVWLWLPSLKKIRKVSQAEEDDSFLGTEFSVEDISTRRYGYETYKLIGEGVFSGYKSKVDNKTYGAGIVCYRVEARPKKKNWYYQKRIVWVDKKTGAAIFDEYYDKKDRKFKVIFRDFAYPKDGCWRAILWEVHNFLTGHTDVILLPNCTFNQDISEKELSPRVLERQQW